MKMRQIDNWMSTKPRASLCDTIHWIETTFCGKECRYDKCSGIDTFCFGVDTFCLGVDTICSGVAKLTLNQPQKMLMMPSMVIFVMSNLYPLFEYMISKSQNIYRPRRKHLANVNWQNLPIIVKT